MAFLKYAKNIPTKIFDYSDTSTYIQGGEPGVRLLEEILAPNMLRSNQNLFLTSQPIFQEKLYIKENSSFLMSLQTNITMT